MTIIDNQVSGSSISKYTYSYDALGRRDDRQQSGSAITATSTDDFAYNSRIEVIGSVNSDTSNRADWDHDCSYDQIGNRRSSTGFQLVASYSTKDIQNGIEIVDGEINRFCGK